MNNEPVAWIDKNTGKPRMEGFIQTDYDIPLYTHPVIKLNEVNRAIGFDNGYKAGYNKGHEDGRKLVTVKELTDEEIWDFINALCLDMGDYWELTERNAIPMIRAILRKAQEK